MALNLTRIMWDTYRAHIMMSATSRTLPGMLVEVNWHLNGSCTIERDEGYIWHVSNKFTEAQCATQDYGGSIIDGAITDKIALESSIKIPKIGIEATGGFKTENKVVITIGDIKMKGFENTFLHFDVQKELRLLKTKDFKKYKQIKNDLFVTEAYYVKSFSAEFSSEDEAKAKIAFEEGEIKIDVGYEGSWKTGGKLTVKNSDPKVPFAIKGIRI